MKLRIGAGFLLGLMVFASGPVTANHIGSSHADDPLGDQLGPLPFVPVGGTPRCQENLSDITSLDVTTSADSVTIRLGIIDLINPRLTCAGVVLGQSPVGKSFAGYELTLLQDPGEPFGGDRTWIHLNVGNSGNGNWGGCGGLSIDTPNVWFSRCMGTVTFEPTSVALTFPLAGTARHFWTGEEISYELSGTFAPSATTISYWEPAKGGCLQVLGIQVGPCVGVAAFFLHDSVTGPEVHL